MGGPSPSAAVPSQYKHLKPSQVKYLAFEGGGGKGAAYIGALAAFAEKDIGFLKLDASGKYHVINSDKILGISGSSAGAITATLLACGYSLEYLFDFTTGDTPSSFYDPASSKKGYRYLPDADVSGFSGDGLREYPEEPFPKDLPIPFISSYHPSGWISNMIANMTKSDIILNMLILEFNSLLHDPDVQEAVLQKLLSRFGKDIPPVMLEQLKKEPLNYIKNLIYDGGLFSGFVARKTFDNLISSMMKNKHEVTFEKWGDYFKTELILTGTNIETGKSQYFSAKDTPKLMVVDGLRISMGFPFAFKPVKIKRDVYLSQIASPQDVYGGTWVDGGVLNNTPIHAFDKDNGPLLESVLGIRLDEDPGYNPTNGFEEIMKALLNTIISYSTEESRIRNLQEKNQTMNLPTTGLDTLNFKAEAPVLKDSLIASSKAVMTYFNLTGGNYKIASDMAKTLEWG